MKRNRTRKLSKQLFGITLTIMIFIISIIMSFQFIFFDRFYQSYKTNKLNGSVEEAAALINSDTLSYSRYMTIRNDLIFNENTSLSVVDIQGNDILYELMEKQEYYLYEARNTQGETIEFILNEENVFHYAQQKMDIDLPTYTDCICEVIENNKSYHVFYKSTVDGFYNIIFINESNARDLKFYAFGEKEDTLIIIDKKAISKEAVNEKYVKEYGYNEYETFSQPNIAPSFPISYETIHISKTISLEDGREYTITAEMSLESTKDAANALALYYPYFFAFAFVCAILIAYIYSKNVARPISKISKASKEMSYLNFDKKLDVRHKNEIGVLESSLNSLSSNLQHSLKELKEANCKLEEDLEQKEKQEQVRKEFVANVSHELKTPLGVIQCYLESLKDGLIKSSESDCYEELLSEVAKINRILMRILEISKIESGDVKLNKKQFDIQELIKDNITLFELLAKDKGMKIDISGEFCPVNADYDQIDIVLQNLISNAVKHGINNTDINVKGEKADAKCRISIANKCSNISQEEANQFFLRFYTQDKSRNKESTGLGLSICKAILDAHDFQHGIICDGDTIEVWFDY